MRVITVLWSGALLAGLTGCSTEPPICTLLLVGLTVPVLNGTDHDLRELRVTTTLQRSGLVLHLGSVPHLAAQATVPVVIFTNEFREELGRTGDQAMVELATDRDRATGEFRLTSDGCSIQQAAGPSVLVVQ